MQKSIDEFEFRMNEFSELLKYDNYSHDRSHKLQNDCKYFANLFADLLRENYKLKDQIIEHLRQISVYREELMRITFDVNQTTNEDRKFSKEMASIEILVKYLVEDQKYFYHEKERMLQGLEAKKQEILILKELHQQQLLEAQQHLSEKKEKWKLKLQKQVEEGLDNIEKIKQLETQIIELNHQIDLHLQNCATYEQEITRKDIQIQNYKKIEQEFLSKQTDIDIKHDFAMKELQKKYRNEMKELKIQNANNLKSLQNNYEDKFLILQKNAEEYQIQLEQKVQEFMQLSSQYESLINTYRDYQEKNGKLVQDLEVQLEAQRKIYNELQTNYNQLENDMDLTKKQLKQSREEQFKQGNEIQNLQKEIKSLNLTIQSLENKIKEKTERFQRLTEQMKHDHDKQMQKQRIQMEQSSDIRMQQLQKNSQEQYDLLMRQKSIEINQLKTQLDSALGKFEQYQMIHKDQMQKMENSIKIQQNQNNEIIAKLKEEITLKLKDIKFKDEEISKFQQVLDQKQAENDQRIEDLKKKYEDEISMLKDGVDILVKAAKKPLDDKIIQLTAQAEQKQSQYLHLQTQYNQLQQKYIESEQKTNEKISSLQDEMNTSMNVFNKLNDDLTNRLQKLMQQIKYLQSQYQTINDQIQTKNIEIIKLNQTIKNLQDERNQENHKHQKIIKELQIYIGNKEVEMNTLQQQYVETQGQVQSLNLSILTERQQKLKEKETLLTQIDHLKKQFEDKTQELVLYQIQSKKELEKQNLQIQYIQQKYEESQNQLSENYKKSHQMEQSQQTEVYNEDKSVQDDQNYYEEMQNSLEEKFQKEKIELIIKYEQIIEQLHQNQSADSNGEQKTYKPQIQIIEKIVYKDPPKKESNILGLDVLLKQTQLELEESKKRAQIEKIESDTYINELSCKFQEILQQNRKEMEDLNEQIINLKEQIHSQREECNQLKQEIIEQNVKHQNQIKTLSIPPPSLSTENMIQRIESIKQEMESTRNQGKHKKSQNSFGQENVQDERQISHMSDYSELNSKLQKEQRLPNQRKKLPKMLTSMRSNLSDAQQSSSHNQTQRVTEDKQDIINQRFEQDEQVILDAPNSYNVFVEQRSQETQLSTSRQNKYTVYVEKKKKDMINISDLVQQQQQQSPANSRITRKKNEQQQSQEPKKFVPYYLRNQDSGQRSKLSRRDAALKLNGNTFN